MQTLSWNIHLALDNMQSLYIRQTVTNGVSLTQALRMALL